MNKLLEDISSALQSGKTKAVRELVTTAIDEGVPPGEILHDGLMAGMDVVAIKFKDGDVFVPEVLMSARAMSAGTLLLKPHLTDSQAAQVGKAVIGTVKGDLHDIGKNLVKMMFEGKGIEVVDLGADVAPERFVEAAKAENADIIAMSALLTTTMGEMKNTVDLLVEEGIRKQVTVMVGGAPITDSFRKEIGADIYTDDAASAASAARDVIAARQTK